MKALQQEQEIEQRLAQAACPSPDPPAPKPVPKAATPTRRVATPPAPPPQVPPAPTLAPTPPAPKLQEHPLVKLAESGKFSPHHAAAAAALQQQLLRGNQKLRLSMIVMHCKIVEIFICIIIDDIIGKVMILYSNFATYMKHHIREISIHFCTDGYIPSRC